MQIFLLLCNLLTRKQTDILKVPKLVFFQLVRSQLMQNGYKYRYQSTAQIKLKKQTRINKKYMTVFKEKIFFSERFNCKNRIKARCTQGTWKLMIYNFRDVKVHRSKILYLIGVLVFISIIDQWPKIRDELYQFHKRLYIYNTINIWNVRY